MFADTDAKIRFDHLGLVVKRLDGARGLLAETIGIKRWSPEYRDEINGVACQFGLDGSGICYELLQPLGLGSPIAAALASRKSILNHVAYLVDDLAGEGERMRSHGFAPTNDPKPALAYRGRPIQFFVTPLHFIVELIEAPDHRHRFSSLADALCAEKGSS